MTGRAARLLRATALVGVLLLAELPCSPSTAVAKVPGPASAPEYWFASWHVPSLWASGARGQGVTIAEIDTGVNASLPELKGRILSGADLGLGGNGQIDREQSAFGHGTAMASIMVGRQGLLGITGLAPDAKILPIAVPLEGTTDASRPDKLATAITYAADRGAQIINLSIGGQRYPRHDALPCPAAEQDAVYGALAKGAVVVAAVGNTGPSANTVEDPGSCLGVISVGAIDRHGRVASFSSREPYLGLVAPGVDVPSLGRKAGDAFAGDGTSQAAALVSASLALAKSAHPSLSGRALQARLFATLDHRTSTPSPSYGYGSLDTAALVRARVPAGAADPVWNAVAPFYQRYRALHETGFHLRPAGTKSSDTSSTAAAPPSGPAPSTELRLGLVLTAVGVLLAVAVAAASRFSVRRRAGAPRD